MPNEQMVISDPDFLDGEPIFAGTHVSVRLIVTLLECGDREDDLEIAYTGLTTEMLAYARTLSESSPFKAHRRAFTNLLR
jgi:uncharacterized protein (DUF433 family)